jgi:cell division protease FtsH
MANKKVEFKTPKFTNKLPKSPKKSWVKGLSIYLVLALIGLFVFFGVIQTERFQEEMPLSRVISDVRSGEVEAISVEGNKLTVYCKDDKVYTSRKEPESLVKIFETAGIDPGNVEITVRDQATADLWLSILSTLAPLGLMALFFFFIFRQARGTQDTLFSFGRSKARLFSKKMAKVTFDDVAGVDEAKKELEEVVDFLKNPRKYQKMGARTPKGVLLLGPPGCGKTLLARALAGEANTPFFSMAGSEFMEMLVGVGASRVRDLFSTAKKNAPSIVFIDELESIGRARSAMGITSHDEREQTLNQILVEMDGFTPNDRVIVIGASNRPDLLDPALRRPGRFDRTVVLDMPDLEGRKAILGIHKKGKPFASRVNWDKVAKRTVGFSGADLENMLNEAAILAARGGKKKVDMVDLEEAATKVKLGPEKKRLQSDEARKMTAYHEAGHAVATFNLPHMDPVHRVSIVSRGLSLGYTLIPPTKDRYTETRSHLLEMVTAALGGRAAEEIVFNEFTSGAASDIVNATRIVRRMVIEYGMSRLGPINFGPQLGQLEPGRIFIEPTQLSPEMQAKVDGEIKKITDRCYKRAIEILRKERAKLDLVAGELLKAETIEGERFEELMKKKD